MSDKTTGQVNEYIKRQDILKEVKVKVLDLSNNTLSLRLEIVATHNKSGNYFKILSRQIYELKKEIDYISTYLYMERKAHKERKKQEEDRA